MLWAELESQTKKMIDDGREARGAIEQPITMTRDAYKDTPIDNFYVNRQHNGGVALAELIQEQPKVPQNLFSPEEATSQKES